MRRAGEDWKTVRTLNSINDEKEPIRGYNTRTTILISEDTHLSSITYRKLILCHNIHIHK